jgi:ABC-type antimicrobial peptide transport system permease subunit
MYGIVLFFGLVHGLGFANAFESLVNSKDNTILSILEFSIGIEIGQFIVVICTLLLSYIFQSVFRFSNRDWILVVSCIILGFILPLILMTPIFS